MSADFDVVVVGGGAAGIGAARRLARSELSTLIVEADSRLGGRAWTREHRGFHIDLGCGWLHSAERNAWISIAESAGTPVDRSPAKWGVQFRDLGFTPAEQAAARAAFGSWRQRLALVPASSDRAADALLSECEWNEYIRIIAGFISGARLERLSVADYRAYDEASTENNWRVPSGFGALIARSAPAALGVRLSTAVTAIALESGGVALKTTAGTVRARAAILTVSTSVLAGGALELPAELATWREAAASLPLGRNEKLFLEIVGDGPFEAESQLLGNPRDSRSASHYIRPFGFPVIESFFGGEGATFVEEGGAAAAFDFAIEQLVALFGADVRTKLRPLAASDWGRMPTIGGAYSYALPGHATARATLARSFDNRVFFAGEATNASDFSTAHGAYDSGRSAAAAVIAALR